MLLSSIKNFENQLVSLWKARCPYVWIETFEESRALEIIERGCKTRNVEFLMWSRTRGIEPNDAEMVDPLRALQWYENQNQSSVLVLKDFHPYLKESTLARKLRDLSTVFKRQKKNIVFLSPLTAIPLELTKDVAELRLPLPNRDEIHSLIFSAFKRPEDERELEKNRLTQWIDACCGLTRDEIENALAKCLVGQLDPSAIQEEKKSIVRRSSLLEIIEVEKRDVPEVGGFANLKRWLDQRHLSFSEEARAIRLPPPKGMLLVGIPGCGKSLTALTVSKRWKLPLIRLDFGRIYHGIVGSSESNIRQALATVESIAPCILWIDEIDKGLSGTQSSSQSDGGTTSRVFGTVLTWMQEKKSPVFVVATANGIENLPPELLRKGRFDEIFFIDLPYDEERLEIFKLQLHRFNWEILDLNYKELAEISAGFSGAEIEQALISGRYIAFAEGRPLTQSDLIQSFRETVPLSRTMRDSVEELRQWARTRARNASSIENSISSNFESFSGREKALERTHV